MNYILDLQLALAQILAQHQQRELPKPTHLLKVKEKIEASFDPAKPNQPCANAILTALEKLETKSFDELSKRDWRNIAWGLCQTYPTRPNKLIALEHGSKILDYIIKAKLDIGQTNLYYPLLYSYFALEAQEIKDTTLIKKNWLKLREILSNHKQQTYLNMRNIKPWMQILNQYPELLGQQPSHKFADLWLTDANHPQIKNIVEHFNIPEYGWFWDGLIKQVLDRIIQLADGAFKQKIGVLLDVAEQRFYRYQTDILVALLDRYTQTQSSHEAHDRLKTKALQIWHDPQNKNNIGWQNVKPETKQMVIQWFVRADLEAFFMTFSDDADQNRFRYWMRFLKQIRSSRIFLCKDDYKSRQASKQEFLKNNKGRYGMINNDNSNSFIIQIGGIFIVEFSKMGASYFYDKNPVVEKWSVYSNDLKSSQAEYSYVSDNYAKCPFKMNHQGNWQDHFDRKLKYLGIYQDNNNKY